MSGRRGRRRRERVEEPDNHERWAVSYADMLTVLLGLFIVLFAISQVDQDKYAALRNSLARAFGEPAVSVLEGGMGPIADGRVLAEPTETLQDFEVPDRIEITPVSTTLTQARREVARLEEIAESIHSALEEKGYERQVRFKIDTRGLVIGLVADDVFFANGSADLTPTAERILDIAVRTLRELPEEIQVHGHANTIPISGRYATNWELSADRAIRVLRRLVEQGGMDPTRISAVGFGDARPEFPYTDPDAMAKNRRVDLVVLSSLPEDVRALFPEATRTIPGG